MMQSKNAKTRKFERSTKWLSRIFDILRLDHHNSKFRLKKIHKIRHFQDIKKTEYMLSRYKHTTGIQYFKAISFFLAVQWPKKSGKGGDVTFLKRNFWYF